MFHSQQRRHSLTQGIFSLWSNWAISAGLLILPIILTPLVSASLLPLVTFAAVGILTYLDRRNRELVSPTCFRLPHVAQVILIISAILLFVDYMIKLHSDLEGIIGQPVNRTTPILPILDIAPVTALVCLFNLFNLNNSRSCRTCRNRLGESVDRGLIGLLYNRESKNQLRFLFWLSTGLSLVAWSYYIFRYVNVNLNRTDLFLFSLCPLLCYVLSLIYYGMRYYTLWVYYCQNSATARIVERQGTTMRYIVICNDKLLLNIPKESGDILYSDELKIDVPLKISMPFRENVSEHDAVSFFKNASELKEADVRLIFKSCDPGMYSNVFHYVAFVAQPEPVGEHLHGKWFTLPETNDMIRMGMVSMSLASELSRIYTITMAWKAYDSSGRRLYEIKHYKPTFRLRDMPSWNVDYNDNNWLYVAHINEDKPFYRFRRFWHKLTKGLGN